MLTVQKGQYYG